MTGRPVRETAAMIAAMEPWLDPTVWRFVAIAPDTAPILLASALGTFREDEGVSAIVPSALADELELPGPDFRRITLTVHSDLEGVGLTAAVSTALAEAGIACNMVAALRHDHVFVPAAKSEQALKVFVSLTD